MNETMPSSSDWFQYYEQTAINDHSFSSSSSSSFGFSDPTIVTTSDQLTPNNKGSCNVLKPIRRRSRASKKTPTTLLNANTSNFRALVQQFTGCHRTPTTSFGRKKSPINLNFQLGSVQNHSSTIDQTTIMAPFSNPTTTSTITTTISYNYDQYYQKQQQQLEQPHQLLQHQSSLDDLFFPSTAVTNIEIPNNELLMDDFSLNESFSNENIHDAYF